MRSRSEIRGERGGVDDADEHADDADEEVVDDDLDDEADWLVGELNPRMDMRDGDRGALSGLSPTPPSAPPAPSRSR